MLKIYWILFSNPKNRNSPFIPNCTMCISPRESISFWHSIWLYLWVFRSPLAERMSFPQLSQSEILHSEHRKYGKIPCVLSISSYWNEEHFAQSPVTGGFTGGSVVKKTSVDAGDGGLIPRLGRSPWRRKWQLTSTFLPRKSHGQRRLVGTVHGGRKIRTWLSD